MAYPYEYKLFEPKPCLHIIFALMFIEKTAGIESRLKLHTVGMFSGS